MIAFITLVIGASIIGGVIGFYLGQIRSNKLFALKVIRDRQVLLDDLAKAIIEIDLGDETWEEANPEPEEGNFDHYNVYLAAADDWLIRRDAEQGIV